MKQWKALVRCSHPLDMYHGYFLAMKERTIEHIIPQSFFISHPPTYTHAFAPDSVIHNLFNVSVTQRLTNQRRGNMGFNETPFSMSGTQHLYWTMPRVGGTKEHPIGGQHWVALHVMKMVELYPRLPWDSILIPRFVRRWEILDDWLKYYPFLNAEQQHLWKSKKNNHEFYRLYQKGLQTQIKKK